MFKVMPLPPEIFSETLSWTYAPRICKTKKPQSARPTTSQTTSTRIRLQPPFFSKTSHKALLLTPTFKNQNKHPQRNLYLQKSKQNDPKKTLSFKKSSSLKTYYKIRSACNHTGQKKKPPLHSKWARVTTHQTTTTFKIAFQPLLFNHASTKLVRYYLLPPPPLSLVSWLLILIL